MVQEKNGENVVAFVPVKLGLRAKGLVEVSGVDAALDENQTVVAAGVGALALFSGARVETRPLRQEFQIQ